MTDAEKVVREIRPSLRLTAPQTFWFSLGFGVFNVAVGLSLLSYQILFTLKVIGIIPIEIWALMFVIHGGIMLLSLINNSWSLTRTLNIAGVAIKTAWLFELIAISINGRSPFLLYVWSTLLFFQIINCIYFMPRVNREQ